MKRPLSVGDAYLQRVARNSFAACRAVNFTASVGVVFLVSQPMTLSGPPVKAFRPCELIVQVESTTFDITRMVYLAALVLCAATKCMPEESFTGIYCVVFVLGSYSKSTNRKSFSFAVRFAKAASFTVLPEPEGGELRPNA